MKLWKKLIHFLRASLAARRPHRHGLFAVPREEERIFFFLLLFYALESIPFVHLVLLYAFTTYVLFCLLCFLAGWIVLQYLINQSPPYHPLTLGARSFLQWTHTLV